MDIHAFRLWLHEKLARGNVGVVRAVHPHPDGWAVWLEGGKSYVVTIREE